MKILKLSLLLMISLFLTTFTSCEKDEPTNPSNNPPITGNYNFEVGAAKTASFFGTIIDENKNALSGVAVSIGSSFTVTDANGVFFIENASVNEHHAFVKAEKNGFFLGSRSVVPTNGINTIKIMMLQKQNIGSFDASVGGTVTGNGITIDFQGGVVDNLKNPYTGTVQVAAKYIDPESDDFADYMPGNLIGADASGGNYLESYGMVAIELTDGSGNELQPADGKDATVSFPLSAGLLNDAPATINLWHFDEARGFWEREGEAVLNGNVYEASVSHFSFWNCDIPTDYVVIDGRVIDQNGNAYNNIKIKIVSANWGTGFGFTDNLGFYEGIVPANEALTLEVYVGCGAGYSLVHSENITALSSNATVPDIIINTASSNITYVTGNIVDCSSMPVSNGYIQTSIGHTSFLSGTSFGFNVCDGTTFDYQVYDLDNLKQSGSFTTTASVPTHYLGNIMACNAITEYISWNIDGDDYIVTDNLNAFSQGGTYTGFSGNLSPNSFSFNTYMFNGPGTYVISASGNSSIYATDMINQINSGSVTLTINNFGTNTGDLVDGSFSGTLTGTVDSTNLQTQVINGSFNFYQD